MTYQKIEVTCLSGALGAEIRGVDLSQTLDNQTFSEIRRAFDENVVIFFRDQEMTPEQHLAFGARFGAFDVHPFAAGLDSHPEILPIIKEADDTFRSFGSGWHSDVTFYERPPLGSILYALEVPSHGGDTMWSNMYLAYEALSDGMKETLDGLTAIHSASDTYGKNSGGAKRNQAGSKSMQIRVGDDAEETVEHPVIRTIPESGRKALFVNRTYTKSFKGWSREDSRPMLEYLWNHAIRPEFTCRFRWRKGSVAFWDNRCTLHNAISDYDGQRREMHRVTIIGERPYQAADGDRSRAAAAA
jgi:taurine dioxygenase